MLYIERTTGTTISGGTDEDSLDAAIARYRKEGYKDAGTDRTGGIRLSLTIAGTTISVTLWSVW